MLAQLRWRVVLVGAALTVLLVVSLTLFVGAVVDPFLYDLFVERNSEQGVAFTGRGWSAYTNLSLLLHLLVVLFAFFVGGALIGRVVSASSGPNSVAGALATIGVGVVWMLVTFIPVILSTFSGSLDAYTRSENLGNLSVFILAFCMVAPLSVLASYLGGRLSGRRQNAARSGW